MSVGSGSIQLTISIVSADSCDKRAEGRPMAQSSNAQPDASTAKAARPWPTWLGSSLQLGSGRVFAFIVLGATCLLGVWWSSAYPRLANDAQFLYVDPLFLDFGEAWEADEFRWILPIQNRSSSDVHIDGFASSCRTMRADPEKLAIPARTTVEVSLTFRTSFFQPSGCGGRRHSDYSETVRHFEAFVVPITTQRSVAWEPWRLRGTVRKFLAFSSYRLDFGNCSQKGGESYRATTRATPLVPLVLKSAKCSAPYATVDLGTRDTGSPFNVHVRLSGTVPSGRFAFAVHFEVASPGGEDFPVLSVPVFGNSVPSVRAIPGCISSKPAGVGTRLLERVTLQSVDGTLFDIVNIDTPEDVVVWPEGGVEAALYRVDYCTSRSGNHHRVLSFGVATDDGRLEIVRVPILSYGLSGRSNE